MIDMIKRFLLVAAIVLVGGLAIQVLFFGGISAMMWFDGLPGWKQGIFVAGLYVVVVFLLADFVHGWTGRSWRWMSRRLHDRRVRFMAI